MVNVLDCYADKYLQSVSRLLKFIKNASSELHVASYVNERIYRSLPAMAM
jgi:hypothetical protein